MRDKKVLDRERAGHDRPEPHARGRGRPLPVGDDSRPAPCRRDDHRGRPARHAAPRAPADRDHRGGRRRTRRGLPAAAGGDEARRRRARRAGRRRAGCVHRGLRRSAGRAARPGREAMPGTALGLPALPAGGVRSAARGEPAAAQGILLPPMAADARRALHGGLRPLRRPRSTRSSTGSIPPNSPPRPAHVTDSDDEIPLRPEELTA